MNNQQKLSLVHFLMRSLFHSPSMEQNNSSSKKLLVSNRCGVHLRVAGMLAEKAKEFESELFLRKGTYAADCRSVLDLLSLGAFQGDSVVVEACGIDADAAIDAITLLFPARLFADDPTT